MTLDVNEPFGRQQCLPSSPESISSSYAIQMFLKPCCVGFSFVQRAHGWTVLLGKDGKYLKEVTV